MTTSDRHDPLRRRLEEAIGAPFTRAARPRRLRNGVEIFPAMLEAIDEARVAVEFETFIYWTGDVADRFCDALVRAADRGVEVRVLLDGVGSLPMPARISNRLEASAADVRRFRRPRIWDLRKIDERTHRKILVCDSRVAFVGGVGIAEEWEGDARTPDEWRETHVRIEGTAARVLRGAFYSNWAGEGAGETLPPEPSTASAPPEGDVDVQVIQSFGGRGTTPAESMQHLIFDVAERRVRVMTPYFVPSDALVADMVACAGRGVEVELLVPGEHIDHRLSQLAGQDRWADLLNAGIRIHRYGPTFPHAKVATIDGHLSVIGSMNMNRRSARKDDEIIVTVLDDDFTGLLDRDFDEDLELSTRVDRDTEWPRRGIGQRVAEWWTRKVLRSQL